MAQTQERHRFKEGELVFIRLNNPIIFSEQPGSMLTTE